MVGESRKWMMLLASIWIQAFTGTNFDFSSYSSEFKSVLNITQLQLNYLSVASDMGKAFGWCSGVSLLYFPLWLVMFMAACLGLVGYGFQWLVIHRLISLPYIVVSFLQPPSLPPYLFLHCLFGFFIQFFFWLRKTGKANKIILNPWQRYLLISIPFWTW